MDTGELLRNSFYLLQSLASPSLSMRYRIKTMHIRLGRAPQHIRKENQEVVDNINMVDEVVCQIGILDVLGSPRHLESQNISYTPLPSCDPYGYALIESLCSHGYHPFKSQSNYGLSLARSFFGFPPTYPMEQQYQHGYLDQYRQFGRILDGAIPRLETSPID